MKRIAWRFIAGVSLIALAAAGHGWPSAAAQTRPVYGGTLRIEMRATVGDLDPLAAVSSAEQELARDRLAALVFDTLTRLDARGIPQPHLALSWTHDPDYRHWQFRVRPDIRFHDGTPLTPSTVAQSLEARLPGHRTSVFGETLVIQADAPSPGLLAVLAGSRGAVMRPGAQGLWQGTGPFRLDLWEEGRALFSAYEEHWRGRPYLDRVEVRMGRPLREQMIALELGHADVVEIPVENVRRAQSRTDAAGPAGPSVWSSAPVEWMGVALAPERAAEESWRRLARAISLAVDRTAIHNVLLQRQGEVAGGLLPQWLSGYAFLFSAEGDAERAAQLVAQAAEAIPGRGRAGVTATLGHDAGDPLARVVAERIALSARGAGLNLQVREAGGDFRLVRTRLRGGSPRDALVALGRQLGVATLTSVHGDAQLDELFESERAVVESGRVAPLFHLPESLGLGARVRGWDLPAPAAGWGEWRLEEVWLVPGEPGPAGETR